MLFLRPIHQINKLSIQTKNLIVLLDEYASKSSAQPELTHKFLLQELHSPFRLKEVNVKMRVIIQSREKGGCELIKLQFELNKLLN